MTKFKAFEIGDKVWLSSDSDWVDEYSNWDDNSNPLGQVGIVIKVVSDANDFDYTVMWENGQTNEYRSIDLIPVLQWKPVADVVTEVDTHNELVSLVEEQEAHIENLEEAMCSLSQEVMLLRSIVGNMPALQSRSDTYIEMANALRSHPSYIELSGGCFKDELLFNIKVLQNK